MKKCVLVWAVALVLTLLVSARAFAQSAGSFAGDFVGVDIIKTIVCSAGDLDLTCTGLPVVSCTEPETIGLILSTLSAHSFNFLAENVGSGVYTVKLNIGATATATSSSIAAKSQVGVGVGIVGIENCVRAS